MNPKFAQTQYLVRKKVLTVVGAKFHEEMNGRTVSVFQQNFNPFVSKLNVDFSRDTEGQSDHRLGLAAALLLLAIERKQG